MRSLKRALHTVGVVMREKVATPMKERAASLETRLATVETRTGALSMLLGKDPQVAGKLSAFETLEARIRALEERPVMRYCGVWSADDHYAEGEFCTHAGSLWACREKTRSRPGTDDTWQLAAKKGRDAR